MTFEGLSDFSLSWAAYAWKDKTKGLKIHIFPDFFGANTKPKTCPQSDCNVMHDVLLIVGRLGEAYSSLIIEVGDATLSLKKEKLFSNVMVC